MTRKTGLAGGFGARYGTVTRRRYIAIVTGLRSKHECPRCMFRSVKRWSVGVWHCRKCGYKFAGGAYAPTTKLGEIENCESSQTILSRCERRQTRFSDSSPSQ